MSGRDFINQFVDAAGKGDENTVRSLLLASKVNINDKNKFGKTALMYAASNNRESMVSLLIDKGADINMKRNNNGWTALMDAAMNNKESIVSLLIDRGADINIKSNSGFTALMDAASYNKESIV